jgi:glyoxylase-like metal-dependent hydrolase (beta-lactamase superfamily II)
VLTTTIATPRPRPRRATHLTLLILLAAGLTSSGARAQDSKAALDAAAAALGATTLKSIQVSGHGSDYVVGQMYDAHSPWSRFNMPSFAMTIDYATPAMRTERIRAQGEDPPRGGALQPLVGQQRLVQFVSGRTAWNQTGENPTAAGTGGAVRGESPGVGLHAPTAVDERLLQILFTPAGFIKAALASNASVRTETIRGSRKTIVSFESAIKLRLEGILNEQALLERIETSIDHPVLGDTMIEALFFEYKDYGGIKFPGRITYREGGYPAFDLIVTEVKPNAPAVIEVPAAIIQAAAPAPAALVPQQMSDGVWLLPGGSQSVVVEFRDHLVVIDAPVDEQRSIAAIEAIRKLVPAKPIRYVVNTHLHFDHVGGLRAYAAEGASIITQRDNIAYFEQVWANPRTINPDRLAKSGKKAVFESVVGSRTLSDGARRLVLYHCPGNAHNSGMLMAFLPRERILFEADSYIPSAAGGAPHPAIPNLLQFYEVLQRLRLDVDQILPSHGRVATFAELTELVEKSQTAR